MVLRTTFCLLPPPAAEARASGRNQSFMRLPGLPWFRVAYARGRGVKRQAGRTAWMSLYGLFLLFNLSLRV